MKSLSFLRSYQVALKRIPDPEIRWKAFEYIQSYAFDGVIPEDEEILEFFPEGLCLSGMYPAPRRLP